MYLMQQYIILVIIVWFVDFCQEQKMPIIYVKRLVIGYMDSGTDSNEHINHISLNCYKSRLVHSLIVSPIHCVHSPSTLNCESMNCFQFAEYFSNIFHHMGSTISTYQQPAVVALLPLKFPHQYHHSTITQRNSAIEIISIEFLYPQFRELWTYFSIKFSSSN